MTRSKKQSREKYEAKLLANKEEERLDTINDAYTSGAFRFIRLTLHVLATLQFFYGLHFYWFKVNRLPAEEELTEAELRMHWGGKFRFLTFLDVILQALYHSISLLNDFFGSNAVLNYEAAPFLRRLKDFFFASLAFPIACNVSISFWVIYAYDRELIFPAELDAIFPNWLNHVVHTNVAMMILLDLLTCFRKYPRRSRGLGATMLFMFAYTVWMHVVKLNSGHWPYPLLDVLNLPMRYVMLAAMMGFSAVCYLLGEFVNTTIWQPELNLVNKLKAKTQ